MVDEWIRASVGVIEPRLPVPDVREEWLEVREVTLVWDDPRSPWTVFRAGVEGSDERLLEGVIVR